VGDEDVTVPHSLLTREGRHLRGVWFGGFHRRRAVEWMATQRDDAMGDARVEECSCTVPHYLRNGREFDRSDQRGSGCVGIVVGAKVVVMPVTVRVRPASSRGAHPPTCRVSR
jgi:hypothetical protein